MSNSRQLFVPTDDLYYIAKIFESMAKEVDPHAILLKLGSSWLLEWSMDEVMAPIFNMYFYSDHTMVSCDDTQHEYCYSDPDFMPKVSLLFQRGNK